MGTEAQLHFHKTCQSASPFKGLIRHSFPALNSTCVSTTFPSSVASRDLWKPEADGDLLTHLPFMADFSFQASSVSHYSVYLHDIRQSLEHLVNPKRLFTHEFQHGQSQPSHKTNQREGWGSGAFLTPRLTHSAPAMAAGMSSTLSLLKSSTRGLTLQPGCRRRGQS